MPSEIEALQRRSGRQDIMASAVFPRSYVIEDCHFQFLLIDSRNSLNCSPLAHADCRVDIADQAIQSMFKVDCQGASAGGTSVFHDMLCV